MIVEENTTLADNTPIIVGVGQFTQPVPSDLQEALSHAQLAAKAAEAALADTGVELASQIDTVAAVRTFSDSNFAYACPFGGSNNFPRSVAQRIGANPQQAIYDVIGGETPQKLVSEFSEKLAEKTCEMVLLVGGEAMANSSAAFKAGAQLNWHEKMEGQLEDRGCYGGYKLITRDEMAHGLIDPAPLYALMENARRGELGQDREQYNGAMADLFAPFSKVAASNPHAMFKEELDVDALTAASAENRMHAYPYCKNLMAKDRVNQGAAILLTTVGKAKALGIDAKKWVFLHAYSNASERVLLERYRLGFSSAMAQTLTSVLNFSGLKSAAIKHFDIYSCFPIVVSLAQQILGLASDDPRPLTQTGGLPFFGGPGNNYSMHGIASMVESLRADPGSFGLVYANGGWMSKHAAGVYSTKPPEDGWRSFDNTQLQERVDSEPVADVEPFPDGAASIETYTIRYKSGEPNHAVIVGRLLESNKRFYARTHRDDQSTLEEMMASDPLGRKVLVSSDPKANLFAFDQSAIDQFKRPVVDTFLDRYEYCEVERKGHLLIVTINRPEVRNALHPMANDELEGIFNAYEKDSSLWVAILTGAGNEAFSAGNDLKYMAAGGSIWVPRSGFAGLTSRVNRTKPIIAAVNGSALGGGLEIAMATDIIVAAEHARFGLPEVKVGLYAGAGGLQRLPRTISPKIAMEMILTGKPVDAKRALELGLINQIVPAEQLLEAAEAMAEMIMDGSPLSVSCSMEVINKTSRCASVDDAVVMPLDTFDRLINSDDMIEGAMAFALKRKPKWRGH